MREHYHVFRGCKVWIVCSLRRSQGTGHLVVKKLNFTLDEFLPLSHFFFLVTRYLLLKNWQRGYSCTLYFSVLWMNNNTMCMSGNPASAEYSKSPCTRKNVCTDHKVSGLFRCHCVAGQAWMSEQKNRIYIHILLM